MSYKNIHRNEPESNHRILLNRNRNYEVYKYHIYRRREYDKN